jgi:hypothetical protein
MATKTGATRKTKSKASNRELIDTGRDKRFVRRDGKGQFKESDDVGKSIAQDRRRKATKAAKSGRGDRGDRSRMACVAPHHVPSGLEARATWHGLPALTPSRPVSRSSTAQACALTQVSAILFISLPGAARRSQSPRRSPWRWSPS